MADSPPLPSQLESLPVELIEFIIAHLHRGDIAWLLSCSRYLRFVLQDDLWDQPENHNAALRWGCKTGDVQIIRRAVEHGANPNVYLLPSGSGQSGKRHTTSPTLQAVAKRGHGPAFAALLELGADFCGPQRWLVRHVCASVGHDAPESLVRVFMNELERRQFQFESCPAIQDGMQCPDASVSELLVRFIQAGAPLNILRALLDDWHADPNAPQACEKPDRLLKCVRTLTPLAAAIFAGSAPAFELLISRGAHVDGTNPSPTRRNVELAFDVPVLAAAYAMARLPRGCAMMELVLAHGAEVNPAITIGAPLGGRSYALGYTRASLRWTTPDISSPLSVMAGSVIRWAADDGGPDPAEMYRFLLGRGARPDPGAGAALISELGNHQCRPRSARESWLFRRNSPQLEDPRVRDFIQVVMEHGMTLKELDEQVWDNAFPTRRSDGAPCEAFARGDTTGKDHPDMRSMEELLAARISPAEAATVFHQHLERLVDRLLDPWGQPWENFIAAWYLSRGFDINAAGPGTEKRVSEPPLWSACRTLKESMEICLEYEIVQEWFCEFVRFLILKGADPYLEIGEKTVFDLLYEGVDDDYEGKDLEWLNTKGEECQLLGRVATVLRGGGALDRMILCPECEGHLVDSEYPDRPLKRDGYD